MAKFSGDTAERLQQRTLINMSINPNGDEHELVNVYARQTSEFLSGSALSQPPTAILTTDSGLAIAVQATGTSSATNSVSSSTTASQTAGAVDPSETSHNAGPYLCTTSIGISTLTNVLADYFQTTENDVNATFNYLEFNVHLAASPEDPTGGATTLDLERLPSTGDYISNIVNMSLTPYIYTPFSLRTDRANLNQSWFLESTDDRPFSDYFTTQPLSDGSGLYTLDGWPSVSIIMLRRALRIIVGIRSIDPQMQQYNSSADVDTVFPPGYISNPIDTALSSNGTVTGGCFYQPNVTTLSAVNSSWAVSDSLSNVTSLNTTSNAALDLSSCGISPILNATLSNSPPSTNASIYLDFVRGSLWGWADDEPGDTDMSGGTGSRHCAVANMTNGGRWQVTDCDDQHYAACRADNSPYVWTVSDSKSLYYKANTTCDDKSNFAVPRTALENQYMLDAMRTWITRQDDDDDAANIEVFWLNFNDLDIEGCWVSGVNQTCPYQPEARDMTRTVVIPVVAGIIVFFLAILTITVKCAANRRNTRSRRKRGEGGWDYEGVPS